MCDRDGAEESARAAAPIGVDVEAVMTGFRANDRVSFRRSARVRSGPFATFGNVRARLAFGGKADSFADSELSRS
jgi:hypothetical protein